MDEVAEQQAEQNNQPSYWPSVGIAGVIFGIIVFALSLVTGYTMINSEPTGSLFSPVQIILWVTVCLVGAFGGMLAIWHYANEYDISIKLGKGALIGLFTGICLALVTVVLNQIWQVIDPDMTQKMIDSTIANFEAADLPDAQKQQMIDSTVQSMRNQNSIGKQLLYNLPMYGILNVITGMIGAKVFGKQEE
jgi:magnesium-transporting ATPase (P-type)